MPTVAVIGGQWGDEGKGKIVDLLAQRAEVVVRFSGGSNAGHTVVNDRGTFALHLVPAGIFNPGCLCVIGNGVVVDPKGLLDEVDSLRQAGVDVSRLKISSRANLVMPYHMLLDRLEEESRGGRAIGTTLRGIGPAYADRVARQGIRAGDLLDHNTLLPQLRTVLEQKNRILTNAYKAQPLSADEVYRKLCEYGERLAPFITYTEPLLREALEAGRKVLFEGAQGTLLDLDFGSYPYVTSSTTTTAGIFTGAGMAPRKIDTNMGVFKAYNTRVGAGPMPTELKDALGDQIRNRAGEFGATTGRPRRCGWFDAVAARYSVQVNGFNAIALTRLDVLDILPVVKICTAYRMEGQVIQDFPTSAYMLERCLPVYEELPGWQADTSQARTTKELPRAARAYIKRIEELAGCRVELISVGAQREHTIEIKEPFRTRR